MNINGASYRTIWVKTVLPPVIQIIDQRFLPHRFVIEDLQTLEDFEKAIRDMHVRGAPLIGATAAYAMFTAAYTLLDKKNGQDFYNDLLTAAARLKATRPTAVNLAYAVDRMLAVALVNDLESVLNALLQTAHAVTEESVEHCRLIGEKGLPVLEALARQKSGRQVNVLTHCNAGWLACIDYGTATSPIYAAYDQGIPIHVWVDETRPRNQGASLTAFELKEHGVPHTVITDNAGGHLMQHGKVDMVIVGTDRTTGTGDVANKIGTYLKALAARDNNVPFYVAVPSSSIDWNMKDGLKEIPIEERDADEVRKISGLDKEGNISEVLLTPADSPVANYAFDVTPASLVTGLITERGICEASEEGLKRLFADRFKQERSP